MNEIVVAGILLLLGLSIAANIVLFLQSKKPHKKEYTVDAKALMADLCSGPGLLKIEYVDRGDFFLRSPRDSR